MPAQERDRPIPCAAPPSTPCPESLHRPSVEPTDRQAEEMQMSDPQNTQGTPGADEEADTASGGAPDESSSKSTDEIIEDETTDEDGKPLENPSGG